MSDGATRPPSILLISADQLRFDCLGSSGNPVIRTPTLDRLARRGVSFTNTYAASTVCVPSRQSVLTGQYASCHGALSNQSSVPESTPTLADHLRQLGYQTAAIGKMHFHPTYADYGFEQMRLAEQDGQGWKEDDYHARFLAERGLLDQWDLWDQQYEHRKEAPQEYWQSYGARTSEIPDELYHTTWVTEESLDYLERIDRERPFFLWSSFIKPHHPFDPPAPYGEMYSPYEVVVPPRADQWREKPLLNLFGDPRLGYFDVREMSEERLRNVIAHYYGLVSHIDANLERLFNGLEARGLLEETVVIFFSDHGDYLGQYGLFLKYPNVPYDALAKVPLLVAGPDELVSGGRTVDGVTSLVDLLPTIVSLAGGDVPNGVQGRDLRPVLAGDGEIPEERTVLIEGAQNHKAVRTRDYKYIHHPRAPRGELYRPEEDPFELNDLFGERPEVVGEHLRHLADLLIDCSRDLHVFEPNPRSYRFNRNVREGME